MSVRAVARRAVVCLCVVILPAGASAQASRDRAARNADDTSMALECRGALWQVTFDDATTAGLNPGAVAVSFDSSRATTTRDGAHVLVAGIEDYRPSQEVPAFAVRYNCVVDPASKKVVSVTYDAVDENGNTIEKRPVQIVREGRYVEACRREIDSKVHGDALKRGVTTGGNDSEPDPRGANVTSRGTTTEIAGAGACA